MTRRGVTTPPVEVYTDARVREFDDGEAELGRVMGKNAEAVRVQIAKTGPNEKDVADAVAWSRAKKKNPRRKSGM